ncbi:MAG: DUF1761 domain-containing protein [Pseudomonadota bacterium]
MIYILQNFIPIFVATLAAFIFGGLYYRVFRNVWLAAAGPNAAQAEMRPGLLHYIGIFIAEFWMAAILAGAVILAPTDEGAGPWVMAIGSAIIIWIGFVLPALFVSYRLLGQSKRLIFLDTFHWLVAMLIMAALLQGIGVSAPV